MVCQISICNVVISFDVSGQTLLMLAEELYITALCMEREHESSQHNALWYKCPAKVNNTVQSLQRLLSLIWWKSAMLSCWQPQRNTLEDHRHGQT